MLALPSTRRLDSLLTTLSLAIFSLSLLTKLAGTVWLSRYPPQVLRSTSSYTYIGEDHPENWPISRPRVLMASDNTLRFRLNTTAGAAEWSALVPGDGLVHLGATWEPYTISMMHQLRCLDIMRRDIVREGAGEGEAETGGGPTALTRHCLNYLRQTLLCRGDLQLETMQYATHTDPIDLFGVYECRDWGAVYDAVRENQEAYEQWQAGRKE